MSFFTYSHFSLYRKVYFSPWAMGSVKLSITDYNKQNKPNPMSLAHTGSEKSLVKLRVPKNELFHFFHIFSLNWKVYFRCVRLVAWRKQCVMSEIKWLTVFLRQFTILLLLTLALKNDGWMSIEQSFASVDKIPTYYATFIIFFIYKYENLSF